MRVLLVVVFLSLSFDGLAECKVTPEYSELRKQAVNTLREPYRKCKSTIKEAYYWKAVASCVADAKGQTTAECENLVTHNRYPIEYFSIEHCELIKPTFEHFESLLRELQEESGAQKCET